LYLLETIF